MSFIHCADLHLDSPLHGLERYEGAPVEEMRGATRRSFVNIIDLAIEQHVDAVLIAGDVFDGDLQDFQAALFFANQLRRLNDAGIAVFIVRGNHDAVSKITKSISLPANVHLFKANEAATVIREDLGLAVHGQSFATMAVTDDLAMGYPAPVSGLVNIGLLHTALSGREGHEPYAPTTVDRLVTKGYDYWGLGHIHLREIVNERPWIVFPGNSQGRHARELGPKGCVLVGTGDKGIQSVDFVATDVVRWHHLKVDATDLLVMDDLHTAFQNATQEVLRDAGDRVVAFRVSIMGRSTLHGNLVNHPERIRAEVSAWLNELSGGMAWLEKVKLGVSAPLDLATLATRDDPFGSLVRALDDLEKDPAALGTLMDSLLNELCAKIPTEIKASDPGCDPASAEFRTEVLAAARERLLATISVEGE